MRKTIRKVLSQLDPPATKPRVWGVLRRKAVFGANEKRVRRQLVAVRFCGHPVMVHKKIVGSLQRVEQRIRAEEKKHGWEAWKPREVQCFNWRPIRGGKSLSRHAHAIALDIDPADNPQHGIETTIPTRVVQAFIDEGWTWGGSWSPGYRDAMHFQYA